MPIQLNEENGGKVLIVHIRRKLELKMAYPRLSARRWRELHLDTQGVK